MTSNCPLLYIICKIELLIFVTFKIKKLSNAHAQVWKPALKQMKQNLLMARKEKSKRIKPTGKQRTANRVFIKLWLDVKSFNFKSLFCFCGLIPGHVSPPGFEA